MALVRANPPPILAGAFLAPLGAALATQVMTWLDEGGGAVFSDDEPPAAPPLVVRADPVGCPPAYAFPDGMSTSRMQRKADEPTGGDERVMAENAVDFDDVGPRPPGSRTPCTSGTPYVSG
ncbi:hypothetical protein STRCI_007661 [Streptomyces cinnabarinus]|uniref:Uncharacterized protein n=1 Tax=Streptomyces cinnabarinus TaxID=67287 RepID=A0ABY7KNG5_9ACTN|nr:hypothetical protein [Streptomyces cinnabarinus]WAZ26114.1 hypothetical protein STRCI_007661 [Streptomyces cinnabarinus]